MSISLDEVRHIAGLARLGLDDAQAAAIAVELSSILAHMEVLARVDLAEVPADAEPQRAMPLRRDAGPPIPLSQPPADFAPSFRDGFFVVPRLETHEDLESSA